MTGIRCMSNLSILIAIVISVSLLCFLCLTTAVIKRYRRRMSYQEPHNKHPLATSIPPVTGSFTNLHGMSHIPLYLSPSAPLCTATASLFTHPALGKAFLVMI